MKIFYSVSTMFRRILPALMFSFLIFSSSLIYAQTGASVTTDKWQYNSTTESVIVTGSGFAENENIILVTTNFYDNTRILENHEIWCNPDGSFTTSFGISNPYLTHRLVATGQTSGGSAEVLFNYLPRVNLSATGLPDFERVNLRIRYIDRRNQLVDYPVEFTTIQPLSVIPCYPGTSFHYYEVSNPCTFYFLGIVYGCYDYLEGTPSTPFTVADREVTTVSLRFCESPYITSGPTLVTAEAPAGSCSAVVNFTGENAVTATGRADYGEITVSYNPQSGTAFPVGTTMVTATATNTCGGQTNYYFRVKVTETEPPTFLPNFPASRTVSAMPGKCYNILSWIEPGATDNCPGTVIVEKIAGLPNGSEFPVGDNVITYRATDASGNTTEQSFTITVVDRQLPVADDVVETVECPQETNNPTPPVATDNCDGTVTGVWVETTSIYDPQTCEGTITRKYSFTDQAGNISYANHTYIIDRTIPPGEVGEPVNNSGGTIECLADAIRPGFEDMPVIKDVCGTPLYFSSGRTEGTYTGCEGTIVYVYTFEDCAGLTYDWKYTYHVVRTTLPHIVPGPEPLVTGKAISCPSEAVTPNIPMVEDVCGKPLWNPKLTFSGTWEYGKTEGTMIYNYTWTDCAGKELTWSFTYTIKDEIPPTINCPSQPVLVDNVAGTCYAEFNMTNLNDFPNSDISFSDNCSEAQIAKIESDWSFEDGNIRRLTVGNHTIKVLITDESGNENTCEYSLSVLDKDPPAISCPENISAGTNSGCRYVGSIGTATATDLCTRESSIKVSNNAPLAFDIGTTIVTWLAEDAAGNASTCTQSVTVSDDEAPEILCPGDITQSVEAGKCSASISFEASAADNCSYTLAYDIDGNPITSPHAFWQGSSTVHVVATDNSGNSDECSFDVFVFNSAPEIHSLTPDVSLIPINSSVTMTVDYFDNENNITETSMNWGDGTESNLLSSPHTYLTTGVFPVTVTVTDACGLSDVETYEYIVVYDPSAGFVTGGGWIESPVGAYLAEPSLTGKANFGFVAKYQKGKSVPDGNTEFQFRAGNLNFKSVNYAWLVISGIKAQFKGTGTINESGNYGFILSAIDGDLANIPTTDKFRIKIWDKDSGDAIVYDNEAGSDENDEATTSIAGGSIVIHLSKIKSADIFTTFDPAIGYSNLEVHPNPFSDRLYFNFASHKTGRAQIEIFDATGRKVETIFEGLVESGIHYKAEFEPNSVISGLYIYFMTLGNKVYYGKVIYRK